MDGSDDSRTTDQKREGRRYLCDENETRFPVADLPSILTVAMYTIDVRAGKHRAEAAVEALKLRPCGSSHGASRHMRLLSRGRLASSSMRMMRLTATYSMFQTAAQSISRHKQDGAGGGA